MSWVNNEETMTVFIGKVGALLIERDNSMFTASNDTISLEARKVVHNFTSDGHPLDTFATPESAFESLAAWYDMQSLNLRGVVLSVKVEKETPSGVVSFGITAEVDGENTSEFRGRALMSLKRELDHHLRLVMGGAEIQQAVSAAPATEYTQETVDCVEVSHDYVDGKHRIRLHGGRWQKFGVPVYPEVMAQLGWTNESIPMGRVPKTGKITIMLKQDKPVKVLQYIPS